MTVSACPEPSHGGDERSIPPFHPPPHPTPENKHGLVNLRQKQVRKFHKRRSVLRIVVRACGGNVDEEELFHSGGDVWPQRG
ncbi:hypothetical protein Pcinc_038303 [Petrolisthes cinctipes]|uniref:Uncharacterized protein n=1 Tax=Petrolisthes cinctipes TaxID=88211 RepID=A0AAE1ELQ3_PETCI|nr:hypothetical protein Pcinc_038303 [Petrolisthes cinctipes]